MEYARRIVATSRAAVAVNDFGRGLIVHPIPVPFTQFNISRQQSQQ